MSVLGQYQDASKKCSPTCSYECGFSLLITLSLVKNIDWKALDLILLQSWGKLMSSPPCHKVPRGKYGRGGFAPNPAIIIMPVSLSGGGHHTAQKPPSAEVAFGSYGAFPQTLVFSPIITGATAVLDAEMSYLLLLLEATRGRRR